MEEANMQMGQTIYESVCKVLADMGVEPEKNEEKLAVYFGNRGKDMDHDLIMQVDVQREAIVLLEKLPFRINPEKATDVAVAVCYANDGILSGKFTYDMGESIFFEIAQFYSGSLIGEKTLGRMIMTLIFAVEDYDDKFMALNNGYITTDAFKNDGE